MRTMFWITGLWLSAWVVSEVGGRIYVAKFGYRAASPDAVILMFLILVLHAVTVAGIVAVPFAWLWYGVTRLANRGRKGARSDGGERRDASRPPRRRGENEPQP